MHYSLLERKQNPFMYSMSELIAFLLVSSAYLPIPPSQRKKLARKNSLRYETGAVDLAYRVTIENLWYCQRI